MATFTMATLESVRGEIFHSKYYLNIRSGYMAPVTLHCSYGDSGETVSFYIFDGTQKLDLGSAVASVHGTRIDGADFGPFACTISDGNKVSFQLDSAMTAVEGSAIAEITITGNGATIGTCNFGILVENAVFPNGVAYDNDPAVYQNILTYVQTLASNIKGDLREEFYTQIGNESTARSTKDNNLTSQITSLSTRVETAISGVTQDSELIDIRNGYNNKTYSSAGTAVRSQISDIWGALNSAEFSKEVFYPVALSTGGNGTTNNRVVYQKSQNEKPFFCAGDVITWSGTNLRVAIDFYRNKSDIYEQNIGSTGWITGSLNYTMPFDCYVYLCVARLSDSDSFSDKTAGGAITRTTNAFAYFLRANSYQPTFYLGTTSIAPNNRLTTGWIIDCQQGDVVFKANNNLRIDCWERASGADTADLLADSGWTYNNIYVVRNNNSALRISLAKELDTESFSSVDEAINSVYIFKNSSIGGSSSGSGIIARNADILQKVYASSYYGHDGQGISNINKQFSLLVVTDIHADTNRFNSAINYLNNIVSIDAGICLGDIAANDYSESKSWYINTVLSSSKPFYTVIGNHDGGNSASRSISATKAEQLAAYITPTASKIGFTPTKTYYSITNDTYKVVIIILDCYDVPDTISGTDFVFSRGLDAYSKAQVDWFVSTLASVPEDYTVMICQHCQYDNQTKVQCVWSKADDYIPTHNEIREYESMIPDIVNAWKNRTTVSKNYAPVTSGLPTIAVSADFSGLSAHGRFAGYFIGHTHQDIHTYITKYPDQLVFCFDVSKTDTWANNWSDLPRVSGTKSEDCITVVTIDNSTDTVRLVRVGSNITTDMRDRSMFISKFDQAVTS